MAGNKQGESSPLTWQLRHPYLRSRVQDDPELVEKYDDKIWKGFVA